MKCGIIFNILFIMCMVSYVFSDIIDGCTPQLNAIKACGNVVNVLSETKLIQKVEEEIKNDL